MGPGRTGTLGRQAERTALEHLVRKGLTPIDKNFRHRGGEIDLIMLHDHCLVFVEVRYRTSCRFSNPELTVDSRKQRKIIATAALYLARSTRYSDHTVRFDVVAVTGSTDPTVLWIRDAFRPRHSTL